jgi:hypothetical protein
VGTVDEAVAAVARIGELDRATIRGVFERRFSADRMAADYEEVYAALASADRIVAPDRTVLPLTA